jgi:hypothetical protein
MTPTLSTYSSDFARLVLDCISREYPNKLDHCIEDASQVQSPRSLHPAFYGCFDWHSAVHGHWMLVHLLRRSAPIDDARKVRAALEKNLTPDNLLAEVAYFKQKGRASFERTYGWAWLLKLAEELHDWEDDDGQRWSRNLEPLAAAVVDRYQEFLPKQTYPIRTGVHPNTAFGLCLALDYARAVKDQGFARLLAEQSRRYFLSDANYPAGFEPGGEDFLSPALVEADLMRRVLSPAEFTGWFHRFLPEIEAGKPTNLLTLAIVSDRSDGKLVHLDGLNLSRAWCMRNIASSLPRNDPAATQLRTAAQLHADDGLAHVASGNYEGEHWLATFAVYLLSTPASE